jgi:threonyl-tRNA synthetase
VKPCWLQDDGHIFCLPSQAADEIRQVLDLVEEIMGAFGFKEYEVHVQVIPTRAPNVRHSTYGQCFRSMGDGG